MAARFIATHYTGKGMQAATEIKLTAAQRDRA
jgi:hypothetical protein